MCSEWTVHYGGRLRAACEQVDVESPSHAGDFVGISRDVHYTLVHLITFHYEEPHVVRGLSISNLYLIIMKMLSVDY